MSDAVAVVHLVWRPLGTAPFSSFLDSYRRHAAGEEHRLVVLYNGFAAGEDRAPWLAELDGITHEEIVLPAPMLDLAAYRRAIDELGGDGDACFLNSYTEILADGWLASLAGHLGAPGVGIVAAGGSFESSWDSAPRPLRLLMRRGFPRFPNPHLRTNGFAIGRGLARELDWPLPAGKAAALRLEGGERSLTRQVHQRGLAALVVGRNGEAYPPERWRESATFRSGGQANALFSDNRTRQYEQAPPQFRARLELMAWGRSDV